MKIQVPRKRLRERFLIIYELEGCQRAVAFLTEYYSVRRMKIILNGRKVGNRDSSCYFENKAYFTKRELKKRTVLHEFCHHFVKIKRLELSERIEEKQTNCYASEFVKKPLQKPFFLPKMALVFHG
jgi:hypothetical protein